jgi:hypothetical protein
MRFRWWGALGIACMLAGSASVGAHHSFAAEFDIEKPLTLKGVITKVEWVNPHVYVYVDVKDDSGKTTAWSLSSLGPTAVRRGGVTRAMLGAGQTVTIQAYHAKDSSNFAFLRKITFQDGHTIELWLGDAAAAQ